MSGRGLEHARDALDALCQTVYLFTGVVEAEGGAHGAEDAQVVDEGLGAVVAGAHGDAQAVEQGAHVHGVDVADEEADDGVLAVGGSEDAHAGYGAETVHGIAGEAVLVGADVVHAQPLDVVDGCGQTVGGDIVGGACLKLEGRALEGGMLKADVLYHLATALIGRQAVEPLFLAVEHADAGGTVHLVAAEGEEVAVYLLHIDGDVGCALGAVDHHGHVVGVGDAYHLLYGVDGAQHIADMADADDAGARGEEALILVEEQLAALVDGYDLDHDAALACLELPGHDVGVVLHDGDDDLVALGHAGFGEG